MNRLYRMSVPHLFILFSLCSTLFLIPAGWILGNYMTHYSSATMRQAVSQLSQKLIIEALETEIPYLKLKTYNQEDPPMPLSLYLFETFTNLQPTDLSSLFASEIPGLSNFTVDKTSHASTNADYAMVMESAPPSAAAGTATDTAKEADIPAEKEAEKTASVDKNRVVFIYHTHNTESWSFATKDPNVTDTKTNITLVGKRLAEELKKRDIPTKLDQTDTQERLKEQGLPYVFSYAQSLKTVQAAMKTDKKITFLFDLHRDSMPRKVTTATINGKNYAKVVFVIGKGNPHWQQNQELAEKMDNLLNKKYPGLSRGIDKKGTAEGNGEYNQSISPNSVLIEVGGIGNTLEESYNSVAALADIFADIYFEKDVKVDAPRPPEQTSM